MTKTICTYLMTLFFGLGFGQQNIDEKESYFPLDKGISKTLKWYKNKYREIVKDTITFKGKIYTHVAQIFPPDKTINMYYRKSNDTIYYFNEVKREHTPFFSINPVKGETVANGTIKKVGATLKTPLGRLKDLLVIDMAYANGQKDTRFYKKGLGLVAVKNNGQLVCYYVSD